MTTIYYLLLTLIGNGRQTNLHMATSMNCKWPTWPCKSEKQATCTTRERKLLVTYASWKPWESSEDLAGKFNVSHTSYAGARVVIHRQTDKLTTITLVHLRAEH